MKRRLFPVIGILLILAGVFILRISSVKTVELFIDGDRRIVRTHASRAADVLRSADVEYQPADQVTPGLTERVRNGSRVSLNRAVSITLKIDDSSEALSYISHQHFGGNILLDAGLRLYPGDRLYWNGNELQPDFNLSGIRNIDLQLKRAAVFTLISEDSPAGRTAYGSGETVTDALLSAGIRLTSGTLIVPDGNSPFKNGMVIEVLPLKELTISKEGRLISVISAGANVGEALARAGMPLMGSDVSIPAAGEPIPADGRILIVPVRDTFTFSAKAIRHQTNWAGNDTLDLDQTRMITEGMDGLKGTFTRVRQENGEPVFTETSEEQTLVQPRSAEAEYGTKINIRTLDTPDGPIEYYRSVTVYATSYSPCRSGTSSCITGTSSGMKVSKGVAAVTSDWYNKFGGQSVYIPDYGKAVIADVGGGIPGRNWIDLAYDDDNFVNWSKETTLYFLTPVPADMVWVLQ